LKEKKAKKKKEKSQKKNKLHQPKPFRIADSCHKSISQFVLGAVFGDEQVVEAGMRGGEAVRIGAVPRDYKV